MFNAVERIPPRWAGKPCFVVASGPSLDEKQLHKIRMTRIMQGWFVMVVNDVYRDAPWADAMYACDNHWWMHSNTNGARTFTGRKYTSYDLDEGTSNKRDLPEEYNVNWVRGHHGSKFSTDPEFIRYGQNSGFQALNLALLLQGFYERPAYAVLVGFDMCTPGGKQHYFGDHPEGLVKNPSYERFIKNFDEASKHLPDGTTIVNASAHTALECFPRMSLGEAIENYRLHRDRAVAHG